MEYADKYSLARMLVIREITYPVFRRLGQEAREAMIEYRRRLLEVEENERGEEVIPSVVDSSEVNRIRLALHEYLETDDTIRARAPRIRRMVVNRTYMEALTTLPEHVVTMPEHDNMFLLHSITYMSHPQIWQDIHDEYRLFRHDVNMRNDEGNEYVFMYFQLVRNDTMNIIGSTFSVPIQNINDFNEYIQSTEIILQELDRVCTYMMNNQYAYEIEWEDSINENTTSVSAFHVLSRLIIRFQHIT